MENVRTEKSVVRDIQIKGGIYTTLKVIRLGLEPKTPTLKVLCSTN